MLFCTNMSKLADPLDGTVTVSLAGRTTMLYEDCHMSLHQWACAASGGRELARTAKTRIFVRILIPPCEQMALTS
jgi:hypothetical protein